MTFSGTVDTLIILVALYTGLAVACSFINESIASLLQMRGTTLYHGIVNLLAQSPELADQLYASPFIGTTSNVDAKGSRPSYLDARNFSLALWETIAHQSPRTGAIVAATSLPRQTIGELSRCVSALDDGGFTPAARMKSTLLALINGAGEDYDLLLRLTDAWFNRQMDRVSGWYRRKSQWITLAIAATIAFGFGVDSIKIVTRLYGDAQVRSIVASRIESSFTQAASSDPAAFTQDLNSSLADAAIPLDGFVDTNLRDFGWKRFTSVEAFLGATITMLAIGLGAPFWFDVLGTIVNVRLAGTRPTSDPVPALLAPAAGIAVAVPPGAAATATAASR